MMDANEEASDDSKLVIDEENADARAEHPDNRSDSSFKEASEAPDATRTHLHKGQSDPTDDSSISNTSVGLQSETREIEDSLEKESFLEGSSRDPDCDAMKPEREATRSFASSSLPSKKSSSPESSSSSQALRSTRSSINPDFAAKQRKFLSKVQNAYLHIKGGDTSSCDSDSEALTEGVSDDNSPEYVPGSEDIPSRRNSITALNGLKRRREDIGACKAHELNEEGHSSDKPEVTTSPPSSAKKPRLTRINSEGKQEFGDVYCWYCHKDGTNVICASCPRAYHARCLRSPVKGDWVCPECVTILTAETSETRSKAMKMLTLEQLCNLLMYSILRMKSCSGAEVFESPVDVKEFPTYTDYISNPMDLSLLERNIKQKMYGSTEAFVADVRWILHNCIIFNTYQSKLTAVAKNMLRICKQEVSEIENCPDCYLHAHTSEENWFIQVCRKPHILVWAKLKGFPFWPAKAMRSNAEGLVDVRFFGAHDRAWVPSRDCLLYSQENPNAVNKGPKKKNNKNSLDACIEEVELHIQMLRQRYADFQYAPLKMHFDPAKGEEQLKTLLPKYNLTDSPEIHSSISSKSLKMSRKIRRESEQVENADIEKSKMKASSGPATKKWKSDAGKQHAEKSSVEKPDDCLKVPVTCSATDDIARQRLNKRDVRKIGLVDRIQEKLSLMMSHSSSADEADEGDSHTERKTEGSENDGEVQNEIVPMNDCIESESKNSCGNKSKTSKIELEEMDKEHIEAEADFIDQSKPLHIDEVSIKKEVVSDSPPSTSHFELTKNLPRVVLTKLNFDQKAGFNVSPTKYSSSAGKPVQNGLSENDVLELQSIKIEVEETSEDEDTEPDNVLYSNKTVERENMKQPSKSPTPLNSLSKTNFNMQLDLNSTHKKSTLTWQKFGDGPVGIVEPNVSITVIKEPESSTSALMTGVEHDVTKARNVQGNVSLTVMRPLTSTADPAKETNKVAIPRQKCVQPMQDETTPTKPTARKTVFKSSSKLERVPASIITATKVSSTSLKSSLAPTAVASRLLQQVSSNVLKSSNITVSDTRSGSVLLSPNSLTQVSKPPGVHTSTPVNKATQNSQFTLVNSPSPALSITTPTSTTAATLPPSTATAVLYTGTSVGSLSTSVTSLSSLLASTPCASPGTGLTFPILTPSTTSTTTPAATSSMPLLSRIIGQPTTTALRQTTVQESSTPKQGPSVTHQIATPAQEEGTIVIDSLIKEDSDSVLTNFPVNQPSWTPRGVPSAVAGPLSSDLQECAEKAAEIFAGALHNTLQVLSDKGNLVARVRSLQLDIEHMQWRHKQEIEELKHNADLVIAEVRDSLKLEMQRRVTETLNTANLEKEAAVASAKRRQWCAFCSKEAMFYCCWNTSYCDFTCQQNHWPVHSVTCTQNPCNFVAEPSKSPKRLVNIAPKTDSPASHPSIIVKTGPNSHMKTNVRNWTPTGLSAKLITNPSAIKAGTAFTPVSSTSVKTWTPKSLQQFKKMAVPNNLVSAANLPNVSQAPRLIPVGAHSSSITHTISSSTSALKGVPLGVVLSLPGAITANKGATVVSTP